jgi:3-oxoacyl-[acyl-carrier-protein] synthase III
MKLIDLLVALTVSEDKMYPLIQAYVWTKIGKDVHLLKKVCFMVVVCLLGCQ